MKNPKKLDLKLPEFKRRPRKKEIFVTLNPTFYLEAQKKFSVALNLVVAAITSFFAIFSYLLLFVVVAHIYPSVTG